MQQNADMFYYTGGGTTYSNDAPGTELAFIPCTGNSDGSCNSGNILLFYNLYKTNYIAASNAPYRADTPQATRKADYAAGICSSDNDGGFTNWYLPAICELGIYDSSVPGSADANCGSNIDNIQINLFNLGFMAGLLTYWSSTEWAGSPSHFAWIQKFDGTSAGSQFTQQKNSNRVAIRCVRSFTYQPV